MNMKKMVWITTWANHYCWPIQNNQLFFMVTISCTYLSIRKGFYTIWWMIEYPKINTKAILLLCDENGSRAIWFFVQESCFARILVYQNNGNPNSHKNSTHKVKGHLSLPWCHTHICDWHRKCKERLCIYKEKGPSNSLAYKKYRNMALLC